MKKFLSLLLAVVLVLAMAGCTSGEASKADTFDPSAKSEGTMTYAEYEAAALDSEVVVECFVQATQGWWFDSDAGHGKLTVYAQDPDGAYFIYELNCTEEDAAKMTTGAKIKVTGYKGEWAGEVEIMDGTCEILEGSWTAEAMDATDLLGTDDLIKHQNKKVSFKGLTIEGIEYKNGEPGDDIYVTLSKDGASYSFCVESYLTGPDTDVYKTVGELKAGDVVDIDGFLYWYEGVNTHITAVIVAG